jgi:protocatechuate 3,4-dioxygenase beta subunit
MRLLAALMFFLPQSLAVGVSTTVRGVVIDPSGAPIARASIGSYFADGEWDMHSDSHGKFQFTSIPPSTYDLIEESHESIN